MKKVKGDWSGHCRAGYHPTCRGEWETPSVVVRCECQCHAEVVSRIVPKVRAKVLVPKSLTG